MDTSVRKTTFSTCFCLPFLKRMEFTRREQILSFPRTLSHFGPQKKGSKEEFTKAVFSERQTDSKNYDQTKYSHSVSEKSKTRENFAGNQYKRKKQTNKQRLCTANRSSEGQVSHSSHVFQTGLSDSP